MAIVLVLVCTGCGGSGDESPKDIQKRTAAYLLEQVPDPSVNSVGGEWTVMGLVRGNMEVSEGYYDGYYDNVRVAVKSKKGVLDERRYTEYARVSMALSAIGKNPRQVEGYDLLKPLDDYEEVVSQGLNGPVFALIAANTCGYEMKAENRYLEYILGAELADGGFSLDGEQQADADITAMVIQALALYKEEAPVAQALDRSIEKLGKMQREDGGFGDSSESVSQVIAGLSAAGIDTVKDIRFIKGENGLFHALMSFWTGEGFCHEAGGDTDLMATEQAMCALDCLVK